MPPVRVGVALPEHPTTLIQSLIDLYAGAPVSFAATYLLLLLLPLAVVWARRELGALGPVRRADGLAIGAAVALCAGVMLAIAPQPIDTNHHGYEELISARWLGWFDRGGMGHLHGYLPVAAGRLVAGFGLDLFDVVRVGAMLGLAALGLLVLVLTREGWLAVTVVLLTGLHPVWLRTAASESSAVLMVAAATGSLLVAEAYLRTRSVRALALTALLTVATMQTRAEAAAFAPLLVVVFAFVRRPGWLREVSPGALAAVVLLAGVLLLPRASDLIGSARANHGLTMFSARELPSLWPIRLPPLLLLGRGVLGLLLVLAITRLTAPERARWPAWTRRPVAGMLSAFVVLLALRSVWPVVPDLAAHWDVGSIGPTPVPLRAWFALGGTLDPRLSGRLLPLLAVLGAGLAMVRGTRADLAVVAGAVVAIAFYAGLYDALGSTYRWSVPAVPWMAVLAARGLAALLGNLRGTPALAVFGGLLAAGEVGPRWSLLTHRYPVAAEWSLVEQVMARPERTVVVLGVDDVDADVDTAVWRSAGRDALRFALTVAGRRVVDVRTALADPAALGDALWFRSLSCTRGLSAWEERDRLVKVAGLPVHPARWVGLDGGGFGPRQPLPCWDRPDLLTCVTPRGEACEAYGCTAVPETPTPYLDPWCARAEAALGGTLLATEEVPPGNLVTTMEPPISSGPLALWVLPSGAASPAPP